MACRGCGVCCDLYGNTLKAESEDLARWRASGREDLLRQVAADGELWLDPGSGELLDHCPFFAWEGEDRGLCAIHDTKPAMCRAYPTPVHGLECVMGVEFDDADGEHGG